MAKNIIPQEDNTSDILRADILKYGYINKKNKIKKHRTKANPADQQENAIRLLKEERHNLEVKLKVTNFNKSVKEHEKYKAKFAELVRDAKRAKFEFNRERKIEMEIDKEILRLEMGIHDPKNRIQTTEKSKIVFGDMNVEYNKLINEQNQLKVKAESSLKRLQQLQTIYNSLMNKLEKGQKLSSFLSEQVIRIQKQRVDAKERQEEHSKMNNVDIEDKENNLTHLRRQMYENITMTEYLKEKLKKRKSNESDQKSNDANTVWSALNAEAKNFIKYLIYIADEQNLEKIMGTIVKMDLDNKCMFEFLIALDSHLTKAENEIERSRSSVADRTRVLSEMRAAKMEQLDGMACAYKRGRVTLREACRASRVMAAEWRRTCRAVDDVRDLMLADAGEPLDRGPGADAARRDGDDGADRSRRPPIDLNDLVAYFVPLERRLDEVLYRVFWVQDHVGHVDSEPSEHKQPNAEDDAAAGESISTGSEQADDFVANDLDGYNYRQTKILTATDPNALEPDYEPIDASQVPSLCPECMGKRFEDDDAEEEFMNKNKMPKADGDENSTHAVVMCNRENVSLKSITDEYYKLYFHRTTDCPFYAVEKIHPAESNI